jgi:hypothetical protein
MPEVILPCPACGSTDCECLVCTINADESQTIHFHMACNKCFTSGPIADDAESAKKLWDSMPRALTWTTEPPKVAGWYFQRTAGEDQTINVAYVYSGLAGLYCKCGCRNTPLKCWIGFEWAGPISVPID